MNSPFEIASTHKDWAVVWPTVDTKFTDKMRFNLIGCIFDEVKCRETGLVVSNDAKDDPTIMWVKQDLWFSDLTEEYSQYLYKYYDIRGAVFHQLSEAEQFKEILEKRYMWQLLKE